MRIRLDARGNKENVHAQFSPDEEKLAFRVREELGEIDYASDLAKKYVKLSGYDRTALTIAKFRKIPLLTGDNALRKATKKEQVEVMGTIGLLDRLYDGEHIGW